MSVTRMPLYFSTLFSLVPDDMSSVEMEQILDKAVKEKFMKLGDSNYLIFEYNCGSRTLDRI